MVTMEAEAEQLWQQVHGLRKTKIDTEGQIKAFTAEIETLESARKSLLVKYAQGDVQAASLADENEQKQRNLERKIQGLQIFLGTTVTHLADLEAQHLEVAKVVGAANRLKTIEELKAAVGRLMQNQLATWRRSCRAAYELRAKLVEIAQSNLSPAEQQQIFEAAVTTRPGIIVGTEQWEAITGSWSIPAPRMDIVPLRPPDGVRHLEELK